MASKNTNVQVPIPAAGVRRDFDAFSMPPGSLEHGRNVIVRKGVLVPRSCHTALDWHSPTEWELIYQMTNTTSMAYDPGNTRYILSKSGGYLIVSDDEFATAQAYSTLIADPSYSFFQKIIHDDVNGLWIGLGDNGNIHTAPDTWPDSGVWTNRIWDRIDGNDGTQGGMAHDTVSGTTVALIGIGDDEQYSIYYSTNGTTWTLDTYGHTAVLLPGTCEIGTGAQSGGAEFFYIRARMNDNVDYILRMDAAKIGTMEWDDTLENGKHRSYFAGAGAMTCAVYNDGTDNTIERSTNACTTWATSLSPTLSFSGQGDDANLARLYHDPTLGYLALGRENHRSADAITWAEYESLPFPTSTIVAAVSDGTDWFIVSSTTGVWMLPSTALADYEKVVSMYQLDTEGADNQIIVSSTEHFRKLNPTSGEFTDLTFQGAIPGSPSTPAVSFDISADPRAQRTVFRAFPWNGGSGSTIFKYLLATNPDLPLVHWRDGENVQWCDYETLQNFGSKVLLISANRVIMANGPQQSPHGVDCSADLNPTAGWGELNSGLLADTPGEITAGAELTALQFAIFKEDCVYHGLAQTEFAGVANAFRYEMVRTGIQGPVSQHSLCRTPSGEFIYLGQDGGVYTYDGSTPRDLGGHVRRIIENQLDFDNRDDSWGFVDPIERLAYFFFPTVAGNMNRGVCIDLQSGAAWEIQLPGWFQAAAGGPMFISKDLAWNDFEVAWFEMTRAWNSFQSGNTAVIIGAENNTWGQQSWDDVESYRDFGEAISVKWQPGWSPIGDPDKYSTLLEIRHRMALLADGEEFTCTAHSLDSQYDQQEESSTLDSEEVEFTTEFDLSGMLFRYEMSAEITRRFVWGGGVARFRTRGEW